MPRKQRMYLPGIPAHVIQRGNNRDACFYAEQDYREYLSWLKAATDKYQVELHAYVLMTNHVHLLLTPSDEIGISKVMQSVGRRYVQYINHRYKRSGTLWEGRHKGNIVDAEDYLLSGYRYIELNPVRARMVQHPGEYRWSSYRYHAYGEINRYITDHALYTALGKQKEQRWERYRSLFDVVLDPDEVQKIRKAAAFSTPLGNDHFREQIEAALNRSVGYARRGRPVMVKEERVV